MLVDLWDLSELSDTHSLSLVIFNEARWRDSRKAYGLTFEAAKEGLAALEPSNAAQLDNQGSCAIPLRVGIALYYSQVLSWHIDGQDRLDFTVIAPHASLASRIERSCRDRPF